MTMTLVFSDLVGIKDGSIGMIWLNSSYSSFVLFPSFLIFSAIEQVKKYDIYSFLALSFGFNCSTKM